MTYHFMCIYTELFFSVSSHSSTRLVRMKKLVLTLDSSVLAVAQELLKDVATYAAAFSEAANAIPETDSPSLHDLFDIDVPHDADISSVALELSDFLPDPSHDSGLDSDTPDDDIDLTCYESMPESPDSTEHLGWYIFMCFYLVL